MVRFKKITKWIEGDYVDITEEELYEIMPWLIDADIEHAVIRVNEFNRLCWEDGIWEGGIWKGGEWEKGVWKGGIWEDGIFKGGLWVTGVWKGGTWKDGTWICGDWERGYWKSGEWHKGVWENGFMWSNTKQQSIKVKQVGGKFIEIED